jgi:hypothetical protein
MFQPEISSLRLALAAEGKAAKTVRNYTGAVRWFVAAHLLPNTFWTRWEQVSGQDVQWWMVWLLHRNVPRDRHPAVRTHGHPLPRRRDGA